MANYRIAKDSLVPLGYGKYIRADAIEAVIPLEGHDRKAGCRTRLLVDHPEKEVVASRSETSIVRDMIEQEVEATISVDVAPYQKFVDDLYDALQDISPGMRQLLEEQAHYRVDVTLEQIEQLRGYPSRTIDDKELA